MGAWDSGSFGNDAALDYLEELDSVAQVTAVIQAGHEPQMDADDASVAIAACDMVAAMMGHPAADMPENAHALVRNFPAAGDDLIANARQLVEQVRNDSELAELWAEGGGQDWRAAIDDLLNRLDPNYSGPIHEVTEPEVGGIFIHCFICGTSAPEEEAVDLVHEYDDGVVQSTMTLHAHRSCVEQRFAGPHWNKDGTPSGSVIDQFTREVDSDLDA